MKAATIPAVALVLTLLAAPGLRSLGQEPITGASNKLLTKDHFQLERRLQLGRHDPYDDPAGS